MYYSLFIVLIVLPIILVIAGGMRLLRAQLAAEANDRITLMQQSMADTLQRESKDAALRLSHFLYADNDLALHLLSRAPTSMLDKYTTQQQLGNLFQLVVLPKENLEAMHFYLRNGDSYQLMNDLSVPPETIRQNAWYQNALASPNMVQFGTMDAHFLLSNKARRKTLLVAALAVETRLLQNDLELACLYFETALEQQIAQYQAENPFCKIALLDENRNILIGDTAFQPDFDAFWQDPDTFSQTGYALTSFFPSSKLQLVTLVDNYALLADYNQAGIRILGISLVVFLLYGLFSMLFLKNLIQPVNLLSDAMRKGAEDGVFPWVQPRGQTEMRNLVATFNSMSTRIQALLSENQKREQEKYTEELKALQAEINPHFLLNTVNTIRFMADIARFSAIRDMAASLMDILNCVLRSPSHTYTLQDESIILESYAKIMQIRHSDAFRIEQALSPDTLACSFPKLLLQPMVENAILHGFSRQEREGVVRIESWLENDLLHVSVWDNGVGMTEEQIARCLSPHTDTQTDGGIGLSNVVRRVQLCGRPGVEGVRMQSQPDAYTLVEITLPATWVQASVSPDCDDRGC